MVSDQSFDYEYEAMDSGLWHRFAQSSLDFVVLAFGPMLRALDSLFG
ncbi:MAG: hypothetical protein HYY50_04055 [Candidatus Kerfeldbacteria bacterium]|nr:hypothetical protein [Candidatus Kerfeldbacteria bacterium]